MISPRVQIYCLFVYRGCKISVAYRRRSPAAQPLDNETRRRDVFFDNLVVQHYTGPLSETSDYTPWGLEMKMLGSKAFAPMSIRVGNRLKYNGKEAQSGEFADGIGLDWVDYGARMYDAQLGRFFVQDRFQENYYFSSAYSYCAGNPIKYIDINGDSLRLGGNIDGSVNDILSILPRGAENALEMGEDGNVRFNMSKVNKRLRNDPGVVLLNSLVSSEKKYLYSVTDEITVVKVGVGAFSGAIQSQKEGTINLLAVDENGVANASNTPAGAVESNGTAGAQETNVNQVYIPYLKPASNSGFDGVVAISGNATFIEPDQNMQWTVQKTRGNAAFHELYENFLRVEGGLNRTGLNYQASHNGAVEAEKSFRAGDPRRSRHPGVARLKR